VCAGAQPNVTILYPRGGKGVPVVGDWRDIYRWWIKGYPKCKLPV
jgi:hypothetical protein